MYLDKMFIAKLVALVKSKNSASYLIEDILIQLKDYFQLKDIILYYIQTQTIEKQSFFCFRIDKKGYLKEFNLNSLIESEEISLEQLQKKGSLVLKGNNLYNYLIPIQYNNNVFGVLVIALKNLLSFEEVNTLKLVAKIFCTIMYNNPVIKPL